MQEQVVAFQLAGQVYGMDIGSVREIIRLQRVMPVPEAPEFVAGVLSLRQRVIPVIDLRRRFGLPAGAEDESSRIIILDMAGVTVGIKVDAVLEVLRLESAEIEPVPALAAGEDAAFLRGVGRWQDRLILLLEGASLLKEREREELDRAAACG